MTVIGNLESKLATRETPNGRRYELRLLDMDHNILCVGCIGLVFGSVTILVLVAAAHLVIGALSSLSRPLWIAGTLLTVGIWTALLIGAGMLFDLAGWANASTARFADLSSIGLTTTALFAVVAGGIVTKLFAAAGYAAELVELKNQKG